jgi:TetR/AcrR family transcriptional regulator, transcriptional repressor for nem operon
LSTSKTEPGGGRPSTYRDQLLVEGKRQFHVRGFHGTAVNDVLERAGIPKGSFYHHFGSKENFGLAILDEDTNSQLESFKSWSSRDDLPISERFGGYFDERVREFVLSDYSTLCLLGRFSSDLAATDPSLRSKISEGYDRLLSAFAELLDEGIKRGDLPADADVDQRASAILALTQGAFVVALANRDVDYLTGVSTIIRELASGSGAQPGAPGRGRRRRPQRPPDAVADENRRLRERIAELERVIDVLRSASVYFASELGKHVDEGEVDTNAQPRSADSRGKRGQGPRAGRVPVSV